MPAASAATAKSNRSASTTPASGRSPRSNESKMLKRTDNAASSTSAGTAPRRTPSMREPARAAETRLPG